MVAYTTLRIDADTHAMLKTLAEREDRTLIATLRSLLSQALSDKPVAPKPVQPKPIEESKPPLTPATKKPFIIPARKPTVPVYGDPSSDDYRPSWDDSETMS